MTEGWVCPRCKRINAPSVLACCSLGVRQSPRKGDTVEYHPEGGEPWHVAIIADFNDDDTATLTVLFPDGETRPALSVPYKDNADDGVPFYRAM